MVAHDGKFFLNPAIIANSLSSRTEFDFYQDILNPSSSSSPPPPSSPIVPYPQSNGDLIEVYHLTSPLVLESAAGPNSSLFQEESLVFRYFSNKLEEWSISLTFRQIQLGASLSPKSGSGKGGVWASVRTLDRQSNDNNDNPKSNPEPPFDGIDGKISYLGPVTGSVYQHFIDSALLYAEIDDLETFTAVEQRNFSPFPFPSGDFNSQLGASSFDFVDFALESMAAKYVLFRPAMSVQRAPSTVLELELELELGENSSNVGVEEGDSFWDGLLSCDKTKTAAECIIGEKAAYLKRGESYLKIALKEPYAITVRDDFLKIPKPAVLPEQAGDFVDYSVFFIILGGFSFGVWLFFVKVGLAREPNWLLKLNGGSINENKNYMHMGNDYERERGGGGFEENEPLTTTDLDDSDYRKLRNGRIGITIGTTTNSVDHQIELPSLGSMEDGGSAVGTDYHDLPKAPAGQTKKNQES